MTDNRRTAHRKNAFTFGALRVGGRAEAIECLIWDVSDRGAKIEVEAPDGVPDRFTLTTNAEAPPREATVTWREGRRFGVTFAA
ncbi:pilus assembly protein PilZ [Methylobacterium trifolii]|uniref:PilZ domain-containing protein n=1 Tax=Methylobacterium trifolii TaxID=1003092 RepID=A0ABQ4U249_9HYPH|nr:pilus assembly protein PilZ [Methylobacterium trifolii]GJE60180.1 hypothetical protein MPOCJGCO_2291 [Methylobacterium trifolii]